MDHFARGYHERAALRDREMGEIAKESYSRASGRQYAFDAPAFADLICRPGCNVMLELDRARDANPANFSTGKPVTAILSQLARRRKIGIAVAVWDWMDRVRIDKNVYHYNTMISVCEKTKDHRRAMDLFHEMDRRHIRKNEVTFSSAISACEKAGQWRDALDLLDQMKKEGLGQTAIAYNAAISACEKGLVPQKAVQVFEEMKKEGVEPTVVTYSALISAAEKGQQWRLALSVLEEMKAAGHPANVIGEFQPVWASECVPVTFSDGRSSSFCYTAYSATISALSKGQQWEKALELFRELEASGSTPSIVTYNATMTALEKGLQWERALDLFDEMKSK